VAELRFWAKRLRLWNGFPITPLSVSRVLYTDASGDGWGGLVRRVTARTGEEEAVALRMAGRWADGATSQSVHTELEGLWRALQTLGDAAVGQVILHRTDSTSTFDLLRRGGAKGSPVLTQLVRRIFLYCACHGIHLASDYVGASVIIKSGADALSRLDDVTDCCLCPRLFGQLWDKWGPLTVDMFATFASVQRAPGGAALPYWGLWADAHTVGVDALTARWDESGELCYAFPPVNLVGKVVRLLVAQPRAAAVLVVPQWPAQWWWPVLMGMEGREMHCLGQDVCVPARAGGPRHPLGPAFRQALSVTWVAVRIFSGGR